ncbi:hypothetical protein BSKO_03789 [Bryopsis sp. KO-2023]|nr:hypothetical protein BSKO_03789 [Bryopsis sp. KO-2023]
MQEMVASVHKGLVFVAVLVGCILGNHALEEKTDELKLEPSKCVVYTVDVPKSLFNVTVDTSAFPKQCKPSVYLKTTGMHSEGSCVLYKWKNLICDATIEKKEDICQEWAILGKQFKPTNATLDKFAAIEEGWACEKNIDYIGFISSCPENVTVSLKVQWGDLPGDEDSFCQIVGERGKMFFEKLTVEQVIVGLIAGFIVFLGLSIWICAQCPCCPFHRWLKTFSEDEDDTESGRRPHRQRRVHTHRFDPDSIEEALLQQEEKERKARQKKRAQPVKKDKRPDQATIPE